MSTRGVFKIIGSAPTADGRVEVQETISISDYVTVTLNPQDDDWWVGNGDETG
jgi:hypothetical protein